MLGVRKLDSSALYTGFVKSDLVNFPSFLPLFPTNSLSLTPVAGRALAGWGVVFNIELSGAAILLKP